MALCKDVLARHEASAMLSGSSTQATTQFVRGSNMLQHGLVDPRLQVTVGLGKVVA